MIKVSPTHLPSLLLSLDYDDLPSRTCPCLFTNSWGLCRVDRAASGMLYRGADVECGYMPRSVGDPWLCSVVPTGGPARLGHPPQSHWLVLNFPGRKVSWLASAACYCYLPAIYHIPIALQSLTSFNSCPCKHFINPLCSPLPSGVGKDKSPHRKAGGRAGARTSTGDIISP